MARVRNRDTAAELAIRRELHRRGRRFFVQRQLLPGSRIRADVVFPRLKVAVFVDGCFWHRCPTHATDPKSNAAWWAEKLDRNVERDRETNAALTSAEWTVIRVWEHEAPEAAVDRVEAVLASLT